MIVPRDASFATPALAKTMSSLPFSRLICAKEAIEVAEVRHVSLDAGHVASDLLDRRRRLRLTAPGDEDVGAFLHELLRRRETDAAVATRDECDFSFKLAHVFLLGCQAKA